MEVAVLASVILVMCVYTSAFKPVDFKPVIFGQNLNKFFGLSIQGPFKDGGEASVKHTSGINGGVDVVSSGAETESKTSSSLASLDHVRISIPETPSSSSQQLTASSKTGQKSSSDAINISNVFHESTISTTPLGTTTSSTSDIQKKIKSLFLSLLQKIADLEAKSKDLGIIPSQADKIDREDKRIPLSFYKLSARILALTNAVLDYEKRESYTEGADARFSDRQYAGTLATADIKGPAGMAFSNVHENVIYVINNGDAGLGTSITALNKTGEKLNTFVLADAHNNDWGALQIAPCSPTSSRSCIYIGDIDRQDANEETVGIIYICEEPDDIFSGNKLELKETIKIKGLEDESAMVMLVTPKADIFVIPQYKHESPVYNIEDGTAKQVCLFRFESQWSGPTDGDISADGDMMLIKTYDFVYFFYVPDKQYIDALCSDTERVTLRYTYENLGEVVTFSPDAMSYYTCNKQLYSPLWRYDRLKVKEVD